MIDLLAEFPKEARESAWEPRPEDRVAWERDFRFKARVVVEIDETVPLWQFMGYSSAVDAASEGPRPRPHEAAKEWVRWFESECGPLWRAHSYTRYWEDYTPDGAGRAEVEYVEFGPAEE